VSEIDNLEVKISQLKEERVRLNEKAAKSNKTSFLLRSLLSFGSFLNKPQSMVLVVHLFWKKLSIRRTRKETIELFTVVVLQRRFWKHEKT